MQLATKVTKVAGPDTGTSVRPKKLKINFFESDRCCVLNFETVVVIVFFSVSHH